MKSIITILGVIALMASCKKSERCYQCKADLKWKGDTLSTTIRTEYCGTEQGKIDYEKNMSKDEHIYTCQ